MKKEVSTVLARLIQNRISSWRRTLRSSGVEGRMIDTSILGHASRCSNKRKTTKLCSYSQWANR